MLIICFQSVWQLLIIRSHFNMWWVVIVLLHENRDAVLTLDFIKKSTYFKKISRICSLLSIFSFFHLSIIWANCSVLFIPRPQVHVFIEYWFKLHRVLAEFAFRILVFTTQQILLSLVWVLYSTVFCNSLNHKWQKVSTRRLVYAVLIVK